MGVGDASAAGFLRIRLGFGATAGDSAGEADLALSAGELSSVCFGVRCFAGEGDSIGVPVSSCDSTRAAQMVSPITKANGSSLVTIKRTWLSFLPLRMGPIEKACLELFLPIAQRIYAHWTKSIELLSDDLVRTMALKCHRRRWIHALLARLGLLRRHRLVISVEVLLCPHIDLIVIGSGIDIIPFSLVLHSGDGALG